MDTPECPFKDGQLLRVTSGDHRGMIVRVDEHSSFWTPETYHGGDPKNGIVSRAGWQIVVDVERDGEWLYIFREHEDEVRSLTTPVDSAALDTGEVEEDEPEWQMTAQVFRGRVKTLKDRGASDILIRRWVEQVLDPKRNAWITR